MPEFVLDESNGHEIKRAKSSTARGNDMASLMADRNGVPPTQEQLQEFQNNLMGRHKDFSKLPREEKERIMFKELENWYFSKMPSIEDMKKDIEKHPLTCSVNSFNESDVKGVNNQHINIKSENVKLTVVSNGKTITFNNRELLEQYRQAVNNQKNNDKGASEVQKRGAISHNSRVFED